MTGFDNTETKSGEDQWQNWSWKTKTAVSVMKGLADILNAAGTGGVRNTGGS